MRKLFLLTILLLSIATHCFAIDNADPWGWCDDSPACTNEPAHPADKIYAKESNSPAVVERTYWRFGTTGVGPTDRCAGITLNFNISGVESPAPPPESSINYKLKFVVSKVPYIGTSVTTDDWDGGINIGIVTESYGSSAPSGAQSVSVPCSYIDTGQTKVDIEVKDATAFVGYPVGNAVRWEFDYKSKFLVQIFMVYVTESGKTIIFRANPIYDAQIY